MLVFQANGEGLKVTLRSVETYEWANRPGAKWPCSQLAGKPITVTLDKSGDLVEVTGQGSLNPDLDARELTACLADVLEVESYNENRLKVDRSWLGHYAETQRERQGA